MKRTLIIVSLLMVGIASTLFAVGARDESYLAVGGGQGKAVDTALAGLENDLSTRELLGLTGIELGAMGRLFHRPASLPDDRWRELQMARTEVVIALRPKVLELREQMAAMAKVTRTYPVDQQAAAAQWKAVSRTREELFQAYLAVVAQAQQILGQESWLSARTVRPLASEGGQGMIHAR